VEATKLSI